METPLVFLTIVLSIFLAIFLLLGIIFLVKAIQVINQVKEIASTTNRVVRKLDGVADTLKKASGSIALGKLVTKMIEYFSSKQSKHKKEED